MSAVRLFVRLTLSVAVAVLLCAACMSANGSGSSSPPASETARPTEPIASGLRTACATKVLSAFIDAFNSRDEVTLGRMIRSGPLPAQGFEWVSMATTVNTTEYTPDGARRMLLDRAVQGERWTLGSVTSAGDGPSWHGGVDAEVHVTRQLPDGHLVHTSGKAALSCIGSVIFVLSLGDD